MLAQVGDGGDGGGVCGGVGGGYCSRSVTVLAGGYCSRSVTVLAQSPLSFRSGFVQLARLAVIRVRPRTLVDGELVDGSPHAPKGTPSSTDVRNTTEESRRRSEILHRHAGGREGRWLYFHGRVAVSSGPVRRDADVRGGPASIEFGIGIGRLRAYDSGRMRASRVSVRRGLRESCLHQLSLGVLPFLLVSVLRDRMPRLHHVGSLVLRGLHGSA